MGVYQGPLEQRFRRWFERDDAVSSRMVRLALMLAPLMLALAAEVSVCPSALIASMPCPGCGLTRAALALLRGELAVALALNPLAPVVCPLLGGAALYAALRYLGTGRVEAHRWGAGVMLVCAMVALTAVWTLRWFGMFGGPLPLGPLSMS